MEDETLDDRRRDGGTNSTLRTKEEGTHLILNEHDDDEQNPEILVFLKQFVENDNDNGTEDKTFFLYYII